MGGLFADIAGYIITLGQYALNTLRGIGYFFTILIESVAIPPLLSPYLPGFMAVAITTVVVIAVIKGILGR